MLIALGSLLTRAMALVLLLPVLSFAVFGLTVPGYRAKLAVTWQMQVTLSVSVLLAIIGVLLLLPGLSHKLLARGRTRGGSFLKGLAMLLVTAAGTYVAFGFILKLQIVSDMMLPLTLFSLVLLWLLFVLIVIWPGPYARAMWSAPLGVDAEAVFGGTTVRRQSRR